MNLVKLIMVSDEIEIEVEVEFTVSKGRPKTMIDPEEYPEAEIISIKPTGESDIESIELKDSLIKALKTQGVWNEALLR